MLCSVQTFVIPLRRCKVSGSKSHVFRDLTWIHFVVVLELSFKEEEIRTIKFSKDLSKLKTKRERSSTIKKIVIGHHILNKEIERKRILI